MKTLGRSGLLGRSLRITGSASSLFMMLSLTAVMGNQPAWADREAGWDAGLANDFNGSADLLEEAAAISPVDPVTEFSFAAALLSRQPLSQHNVRQALEVFTRLGVEASEPGLRLRARFLAARILHVHLDPTEPQEAALVYREVLESHPGVPLADQAGVKLAVILTDESPELDPGILLLELDRIANRLTTAEAQRELHLSRADVCRERLGDPARALNHLIAARTAGFVSEERNANLDVIIAVLAREIDETEIALFYYRRFEEERPYDQRSGTIRRYIQELEAFAP